MKLIIRIKILIVLLLTSQSVWAESFIVGELKYTIVDSSKKEVAVAMASNIIGEIVIPKMIEHMGSEYTVIEIANSGFAHSPTITSVEIPISVSRVGEKSFEGCKSLLSINIPNGVNRIENSAFKNCTSIETINIDHGVNSIGISAFEGCTSLRSIVIPESVEALGSSSFANCSSLNYITLSSKIISIRSQTFANCSSLISIIIPDGVDRIGTSAFSYCTSLKEIDLPNSLATIESSAFYKCGSLIKIDISSGVKTIGSGSFSYCTSIESVYIPSEVTQIGGQAFSNCSKLRDVFINIESPPTNYSSAIFSNIQSINLHLPPGSETSYYNDPQWQGFANYIAFGDKEHLKRSIHINEAGHLKDFISENEQLKCYYLSLSGEINAEDIALIRYMSGRDKYGNKTQGELRYLDLSQCKIVTGGGDYFNGYNTMNDEISPFMFKDCILVGIELPQTIHTINHNAFENTNIIELKLPTSVKEIRQRAFNNLARVVEIAIPQGVTSIENYTFSSCTSLKRVYIPDGVTSIGDNAFEECTSLDSIEIPNSVTMIGKYAFAECGSLRNVQLSNYLEEIPNYCFINCVMLETLTLSENIVSIGEFAFTNCRSLNSLTLPSNLKELGISSFYNCKSLSTITLPDQIKVVPKQIFMGCSSLKSIHLGEDIESIDTYALYGANNLEELHIKRRVPPKAYANSFSTYKTTKLHIPVGCIPLYQNASTWSLFESIKGFDGILIKTSIESNIGGNIKINGIEIDRIEIDLGGDVTFEIVAQDGYIIKSVLLNNKDVTSELSDNNTLTINNVSIDLVLSVEFDILSSSVEICDSNIKVFKGNANTVFIQGTTIGETISIYNSLGYKVMSTISTGNDKSILLERGLYIITISGKSYKIAI
ncbi:MAG: leucine-rich repeat domain-containing protein [Bacteroidales bacterium]